MSAGEQADSSQISFRPLYGTSKHEPLCFLLTVDDVTILLDCGWNDRFHVEDLEPLRRFGCCVLGVGGGGGGGGVQVGLWPCHVLPLCIRARKGSQLSTMALLRLQVCRHCH
jgi:hypothetical protein